MQNTPPKTIFHFKDTYSFSISLFVFLFFYFYFFISFLSTFKTLFLVLLKKGDAAYIFKGRAQMPKTMMQKCSRNCSCRLCSKMLHQWKGKNEHGRHPIASANEIANSDRTKILELFGATFGRHFSSRAPGYQRTCLGRHVFQIWLESVLPPFRPRGRQIWLESVPPPLSTLTLTLTLALALALTQTQKHTHKHTHT